MATKATLLSLISLAAATLNKPVIQPNFPNNGLDSLSQGLLDHLSPTQSTHDAWGAGFIPQDCKTLAQSNNLSPFDFEVYNIHYTDCAASWTFCRHKNSPINQISTIDIFGRMPVHMRQLIRHLVFIPGNPSAGSSGDNTVMVGNVGITVYLHETAHSMDSHAFDPSLGVPFSNSNTWTSNYNQDSAVTDPYAQTSQQENLAQETVVAVFDKVVPGGVGTIQPNWNAIFHQYATIQGFASGTILPGGTCTKRLVDSPPVPMGNSAKFRRGLGAAPKVIHPADLGLEVIEAIPMESTLELTHFDENGTVIGTSKVNLQK